MYDYNAVITNVVDGDTYDVDIDLGFHTIPESARKTNVERDRLWAKLNK